MSKSIANSMICENQIIMNAKMPINKQILQK
jgi:hypothetical protein